MRKIILLFFLVISLLFLNTTLVSACSCMQNAPPKESLEKATAVFAGKVVDVDVPFGIMKFIDDVKVTFEVSKIWKCPDYKTLVLTTSISDASCGYNFRQDKKYIVYAYGEENKLSTYICTRTGLLANRQKDLQELGDGYLPTNSGSNYVLQISNLIPIASLVSIVIIVLLIRKYKK